MLYEGEYKALLSRLDKAFEYNINNPIIDKSKEFKALEKIIERLAEIEKMNLDNKI